MAGEDERGERTALVAMSEEKLETTWMDEVVFQRCRTFQYMDFDIDELFMERGCTILALHEIVVQMLEQWIVGAVRAISSRQDVDGDER